MQNKFRSLRSALSVSVLLLVIFVSVYGLATQTNPFVSMFRNASSSMLALVTPAPTTAQLQAIIVQLQAQLAALQAQLLARQGAPVSSACIDITTNLYSGLKDATTGNQISALQRYLQSTGDYTYPEITGFYGPVTVTAVQHFQARVGIISSGSPATTGFGSVGPTTRARIQALSCVAVTSPTTPHPASGGGGGGGGGGHHPTPVADPTLDFSASLSSIIDGQSTTLTWNANNAASCVASAGWSGSQATSGSTAVSPHTTTTYNLTCTNSVGTQVIKQVTVSVGSTTSPLPPAAPTLSFSAAPGTITTGDSSTLTWSTTDVASCVASNGWSGSKPTSGSASVSPTATTTYTLTCTGSDTSQIVRSAVVNVGSVQSGSMASSITQYGFTWNFDHSYQVGQFVTGDWWVKGPVTVTSVSPGQTGSGSSIENGSMLNPRGSVSKQAFDGRAHAFDATLAVQFPVTISAPASLVSTVSLPNWSGVTDGSGTIIDKAAVLTVLTSPAATTDFRPPYAGTSKPLLSSVGLRTNLLPSLASVTGTPTVSNVLATVSRPWIDFVSDWVGRDVHPYQNLPNYGRDISAAMGEAADMLLLNPATVGDKTQLAIALSQIGIDNYYTMLDGTHWYANGGHGSARKFPILFAGLMLNNSSMLAIGQNYLPSTDIFGEDSQTYYISQADVDRTDLVEVSLHVTSASGTSVTGTLNSSLYGYALLPGNTLQITSGTGVGQRRTIVASSQNRGGTLNTGDTLTFTVNSAWSPVPNSTSIITVLGYESSDIGRAEWGIVHVQSPENDNPGWGADYRLCCTTAAWQGWVLAARLLGLKSYWNNNAMFDYTDYYMATEPHSGFRASSLFSEAMWDAYR